MIKLLVIADDFTGAVDTGVQFKAKGTLVLVGSGGACKMERLPPEVQVLIIDAETRHVSPEKAYEVVGNIVQEAVRAGIPCIYKKTDSGLRGNIGSELSAALEASGRKQLHFLPAFPLMGRVTVAGIHYVDGCPVAESVFGKDPFESVRHSEVSQIIGEQSQVPVHVMSGPAAGKCPEGILVYDSADDRQLQETVKGLKEMDELHLLAGCAGLASALPELLELETEERLLPGLPDDLLVVCGSVNPITLRQMEEAERRGAVRIRLSLEQKLETAWLDQPEGKACLDRWKQMTEKAECAILESATSLEKETVLQYADRRGIPQEEIRMRISGSLGAILERLLDMGLQRTLLVTGGDTLLAFLEKLHLNELCPICEIYPGVVLSQIKYIGKTFNLISKSGGFGGDGLLMDIEEMIRKTKREK